MKGPNLSEWAIKHPAFVLVPDPGLRRRPGCRPISDRAGGGPVVHHQHRDRRGRVAGGDQRRGPAAAGRPDRGEAPGDAVPRLPQDARASPAGC